VLDDVGASDEMVEATALSVGVEVAVGTGFKLVDVVTALGRRYTFIALLPPQYSERLPLQGILQLVTSVAPFFNESSHQHSMFYQFTS
jgi:hypothetical protein